MKIMRAACALAAIALTVGLSGCIAVVQPAATRATHSASSPSKSASAAPSPTPTTVPDPESLAVQKIKAQFPGYPLVVDVSSLDYRVQSGFSSSGTTRAVALVPGLYMAYNPAVTDLDFYIDNAVVSGDCTMMKAYFSQSGGECWDGVQAGSEEPHR